MADITLNYLVKSYFIKNYTSTGISEKFTSDLIFINKIKNKKQFKYSDNQSYEYENCYPNYILNDTTPQYVDNSPYGLFENISDIASQLDVKNNPTTSFVRVNKITDLTYIKDMADNSNLEIGGDVIRKTEDVDTKRVDAILLKDDAMQLVTLSKLESDVIYDPSLEAEAVQPVILTYPSTHNENDLYDIPVTIIPEFRSTPPVEFYIGFNKDSLALCPITNSLYRYRRVRFTPPQTGYYFFELALKSLSTTVDWTKELTYWQDADRNFYLIPDANNPTSTLSSGDNMGGSQTTNRYLELSTGQDTYLHFAVYNVYLTTDDYDPVVRLTVTYMGKEQPLIMTDAKAVFVNTDGSEKETYTYLGTTYDTSSLKEKLLVQVLNIQTHLVLFNTKGIFFEDHEKYAINKHCFLETKFVNAIFSDKIRILRKSIEIRE